MKKKDPFRGQEAKITTDREIQYRINLNDYFNKSMGTNVEKLQSFTKYVPRQSLTSFLVRYELFKKILNIHGSIIECGVYLGGGLMTFAQLSSIFEPVNHQRKIIGFDTFSGFLDFSETDKKGNSIHLKKGGFGANSYEDLIKCIELYDMNRFVSHIPKVFLVRGDIKTTLPKYLEENPHTLVSLLYLDVDIFEPSRIALELLVPRMPKGAIIVFDELNAEDWPGETQAVLKTIGIRNLRIQRFPFDSVTSFAVLE